jgi:NitT/TauT family transport system substrate-binding protein
MARRGLRWVAAATVACVPAFGALNPGNLRPAAAATTQSVTISMGYIPDIQFAPYYVAVARGYYAAAGLNVHFDYAQTSDVIRLVGAGNVAFGNAEADQVIVGRARGLPIVSVFTQYQRFPVVVFALAASGIHSFADLKGKTIGIPGLYGASYTGLLAALGAAHLTTKDVHISAIGYAQVAAVIQHRVDAAVGYAMNEPVQLRQRGLSVTVLPIASSIPLGGPGVIASQADIDKHADLVARFVSASLHGLRDTVANPSAAFALSKRYLPAIPASQLGYELAVLKEAVKYWTPAIGHKLGCADATSWKVTAAVLLEQRQITKAIPTAPMFTNRFVGPC